MTKTEEKTVTEKTVLLAGCGDIGMHLGRLLQKKGFQVTGLKRSPMEDAPFAMIYADLQKPETLTQLAPRYDFIVYTATPGSMTPQAYQDTYVTGLENLMAATAEPAQHLLLVSSTGVYQQSQGEWVDETSVTEPQRFSGKTLLQSEQVALTQWPCTVVVRFAGIYGPGRLRLIRKVKSGEPVCDEPPKYTNRIFRDDCVGMLAFLMEKAGAGVALEPVYLGCDDAAVTDVEVLDFIADQLAVPRLPRIPREPAPDGEPVNQNKRCSNERIKSLGYQFQYPSYREGYQRILEEAGLPGADNQPE